MPDLNKLYYNSNNIGNWEEAGISNLGGLLATGGLSQDFANHLRQNVGLSPQHLEWLNNQNNFNYALNNGLISPDVTERGISGYNIDPNIGKSISSNPNFNSNLDTFGNKVFAGGTGLNWLGGVAQIGLGIWNAYNQGKQLKLAKQAFEEQKALQRANYRNQARAYNNNLRNQQSGRGYVGMSGSAARVLGQEYDARKANETY